MPSSVTRRALSSSALDFPDLALAADECRSEMRQVVRDFLDREPPVVVADDPVNLLAVGRRNERRGFIADFEQFDRLGDALDHPEPVRLDTQCRVAECRPGLRGHQRLASGGERHDAGRHRLGEPFDFDRFCAERDVFGGVPAQEHRTDVQARPRSEAASEVRPARGDRPPRRRRRLPLRRTASACRRSCRSRGRHASRAGRARCGHAKSRPRPWRRRRSLRRAWCCRRRPSAEARGPRSSGRRRRHGAARQNRVGRAPCRQAFSLWKTRRQVPPLAARGKSSGWDAAEESRVAMRRGSGAGEGNRTLVCSLGSCRSAIELHPH